MYEGKKRLTSPKIVGNSCPLTREGRLPPKGELSEKKVKKKTETKLHNLTGIITHKELYKVYHKDSPYQGNLCYKLQLVLERSLKTFSEEKQKMLGVKNL